MSSFNNRRIDAILPAGGRIDGEFAAEAGAEIKALIRLDGVTLLERTVRALRDSGRVDRIVVIGPRELDNHTSSESADAVLREAETGPANVYRGLEWLGSRDRHHADRVLLVTTDLPFISPESICSFLDACPDSADFCIPAFRREQFEVRFPKSRAEYVRLRDGEWTTGCAFLVNPARLVETRPHVDRVFAARKSQLAMARLLGPLFIARFLARRLEIRHIEERCQRILGCTSAAVRNADPALAFDIDLPSEYRYAVQMVGTESYTT